MNRVISYGTNSQNRSMYPFTEEVSQTVAICFRVVDVTYCMGPGRQPGDRPKLAVEAKGKGNGGDNVYTDADGRRRATAFEESDENLEFGVDIEYVGDGGMA